MATENKGTQSTGDSQTMTATQKKRARYARMYNDSADMRVQWTDIVDFFLPRRGKYLAGNTNDKKQGQKKKGKKIINGSATDALRTIAAGMQGGLTSPSRPWFVLTLGDEQLVEFSPVREWLHAVRDGMLNVFGRSNFYSSIHGLYKELAAFGTASLLIEEDFTTVIRCRPFTIGEYVLALDSRYRPNTLYRQYSMSADQMKERFGEDKLSTDAKEASNDPHRKDERFEILHCIEPREGSDPAGRTYSSSYFELAREDGEFLRQGGYRGIPFVAPRWEVAGVNTYGDSPGMDALGDNKMLQKMEEKKLKALDKQVDPPMNAPLAMKGKGGTVIAGGVNYVDVTAGAQSFTPAYQVKPNMQDIAFEIDRVENRIRNFFFNDLFLAVLGTDKNMTATEVVERHEEKMLMLGPVIERLESELLDVIIERTYNIMDNLGMLPPVPPELSGKEIKIEYISLLAQAQQIVGTSAIRQVAAFTGELAQAYPDVVDKFDADEAVDQFSRMVGITPKIVRSDDAVKVIRDGRAAAQAKQAAAEQAAAMIDSAKTLSDTELNKGSALDVVAEQQGGLS